MSHDEYETCKLWGYENNINKNSNSNCFAGSFVILCDVWFNWAEIWFVVGALIVAIRSIQIDTDVGCHFSIAFNQTFNKYMFDECSLVVQMLENWTNFRDTNFICICCCILVVGLIHIYLWAIFRVNISKEWFDDTCCVLLFFLSCFHSVLHSFILCLCVYVCSLYRQKPTDLNSNHMRYGNFMIAKYYPKPNIFLSYPLSLFYVYKYMNIHTQSTNTGYWQNSKSMRERFISRTHTHTHNRHLHTYHNDIHRFVYFIGNLYTNRWLNDWNKAFVNV